MIFRSAPVIRSYVATRATTRRRLPSGRPQSRHMILVAPHRQPPEDNK